MTQIALGVSIDIPSTDNPEECVFCGQKHQDEKPADPVDFLSSKSTKNLKSNGQAYILGNHSTYYHDSSKPPLVDWQKDILSTGGFKAAAHHCMATKVMHKHKISGELKQAGYDPDRGSNCILLPYSNKQFSRARAMSLAKPLQKHSGGHTNEYYKQVDKHLKKISQNIEKRFCPNKKVDNETILRWMRIEESRIFNALIRIPKKAYQLHNDAFLDPRAKWGTHNDEQKYTTDGYLLEKEDYQVESQAEHINEHDPDD